MSISIGGGGAGTDTSAFHQAGDSKGATAQIGTTDANNVEILVNSVAELGASATGATIKDRLTMGGEINFDASSTIDVAGTTVIGASSTGATVKNQLTTDGPLVVNTTSTGSTYMVEVGDELAGDLYIELNNSSTNLAATAVTRSICDRTNAELFATSQNYTGAVGADVGGLLVAGTGGTCVIATKATTGGPIRLSPLEATQVELTTAGELIIGGGTALNHLVTVWKNQNATTDLFIRNDTDGTAADAKITLSCLNTNRYQGISVVAPANNTVAAYQAGAWNLLSGDSSGGAADVPIKMNTYTGGDIEFHVADSYALGASSTGVTVENILTVGSDLNHDGANAGFFGTAPVTQRAKADYNNWAAFGDVVDALVALGLFDAA